MAFHDRGELLRQSIAEELQESEIEGGTTQHCCPEIRWLQEVVWDPETLCSRGWVVPKLKCGKHQTTRYDENPHPLLSEIRDLAKCISSN